MGTDELYPADRLAAAQRATAAAGLDALLLTPGADLRYLTGYDAHPLERLTCLVLPAEGEPTLVVPAPGAPAAEASPAPASASDRRPRRRHATRTPGRAPRSAAPGRRRSAWPTGCGPSRSSRCATRCPAPSSGSPASVLRELRMRKSPGRGRRRCAEAGAAIDARARADGRVAAARADRDARSAADIADAIRAAGPRRPSTSSSSAAGPNGASPHHEHLRPGRSAPASRSWSTSAAPMPRGYCSDSPAPTRRRRRRRPSSPTTTRCCSDAQRAACAAVRPGVTAEAVDAAARDVDRRRRATASAFLHRTGHGIGLEAHEEPYIVAGNAQPLEPGMAFSIEPGIYLAGRHGARIEDIVVCTDGRRATAQHHPRRELDRSL